MPSCGPFWPRGRQKFKMQCPRCSILAGAAPLQPYRCLRNKCPTGFLRAWRGPPLHPPSTMLGKSWSSRRELRTEMSNFVQTSLTIAQHCAWGVEGGDSIEKPSAMQLDIYFANTGVSKERFDCFDDPRSCDARAEGNQLASAQNQHSISYRTLEIASSLWTGFSRKFRRAFAALAWNCGMRWVDRLFSRI